MKRWLPYPFLTLFLIAMWLMLQQSASLGQILLGTAVALVASRAMAALEVEPPRIRISWAIPRLALAVLSDIFRSNLAVGRIILSPSIAPRMSGFLSIPLDMRSPTGLAILSTIMTATPGTLWVQHDIARNVLLIHVLDLVDEDEWVHLIKGRYERMLMEIFK